MEKKKKNKKKNKKQKQKQNKQKKLVWFQRNRGRPKSIISFK